MCNGEIPKTRLVSKARRVYEHSLCQICGSAGGTSASRERPYCEPATCKACGLTQCHSNGLGRGQCGHCGTGLLPGWSGTDRPCGYKGCAERAVTAAPRVGYACAEHAARIFVTYLGTKMSLKEQIHRRATYSRVHESIEVLEPCCAHRLAEFPALAHPFTRQRAA